MEEFEACTCNAYLQIGFGRNETIMPRAPLGLYVLRRRMGKRLAGSEEEMGNGGDNREEEIVAGVVFRERREWLLEACMKKKWWLYMPVASVRRGHHSLSDANTLKIEARLARRILRPSAIFLTLRSGPCEASVRLTCGPAQTEQPQHGLPTPVSSGQKKMPASSSS